MTAPAESRICERCWHPIAPGEEHVRLGHIAGSTLSGDVAWLYSHLHPYDPEAPDHCRVATTSTPEEGTWPSPSPP